MADEQDAKSSGPNIDLCGLNVSALRDLPQTGFGFGRRICTGRIIARNQLFIQMARMLWAFDAEPGVVNEATGERHRITAEISTANCTEGFVTLPKPFKVELRPRGQWARDVILQSGTTHDIDHAAVLDQAAKERERA
ncbi:hypothetical protein VTH82DRAFT_8452 [Thermothelomyces myriococcoides]